MSNVRHRILQRTFSVTGVFEITGRGVGGVMEATLNLHKGKGIPVVVRAPGSEAVHATAFQESLLRRRPEPQEHSAFLLSGLTKAQVPIGSKIEIHDRAE